MSDTITAELPQTMVKQTLTKATATVSETIAVLLKHSTQKKACEELGITEQALWLRMRKYPEIKEAVNEVKEAARLKMEHATSKATDVMIDGLDDKRAKYEAAKYILDSAGLGGKKGVGVKVEGTDMKMEFISYDES